MLKKDDETIVGIIISKEVIKKEAFSEILKLLDIK